MEIGWSGKALWIAGNRGESHSWATDGKAEILMGICGASLRNRWSAAPNASKAAMNSAATPALNGVNCTP
jgi:hypothetical protein